MVKRCWCFSLPKFFSNFLKAFNEQILHKLEKYHIHFFNSSSQLTQCDVRGLVEDRVTDSHLPRQAKSSRKFSTLVRFKRGYADPSEAGGSAASTDTTCQTSVHRICNRPYGSALTDPQYKNVEKFCNNVQNLILKSIFYQAITISKWEHWNSTAI